MIVVIVDAVIAPATPFAPSIAASTLDLPSFLSLKIFSITTIALSTSIPIPSASPPIESIFKLISIKYIHINVAITEIGIDKPTINVGLKSFKKINKTIIARIAP